MATMQEETRMVRKQFHLSLRHVRRLEELRDELHLDSDAELIRRAIDTFDPEALDTSDRELVEATADDLAESIQALNSKIEATLEHAKSTRERISDPVWIEHIRERTRREAASNPALVAGVAKLIGAEE